MSPDAFSFQKRNFSDLGSPARFPHGGVAGMCNDASRRGLDEIAFAVLDGHDKPTSLVHERFSQGLLVRLRQAKIIPRVLGAGA